MIDGEKKISIFMFMIRLCAFCLFLYYIIAENKSNTIGS